MGEKGWAKILTLVFTAIASILVILSVAEYYGYVGANVVGTWTYGDLGVLGIVAAALAIVIYGAGYE